LISEESDLENQETLRWIYGLLCLLEKPLLPDQAAHLSELSVLLTELKEKHEGESTYLA